MDTLEKIGIMFLILAPHLRKDAVIMGIIFWAVGCIAFFLGGDE